MAYSSLDEIIGRDSTIYLCILRSRQNAPNLFILELKFNTITFCGVLLLFTMKWLDLAVPLLILSTLCIFVAESSVTQQLKRRALPSPRFLR